MQNSFSEVQSVAKNTQNIAFEIKQFYTATALKVNNFLKLTKII